MGNSCTKPTFAIHGLQNSGKSSIVYYLKNNKWHNDTTKLRNSKKQLHIQDIAKQGHRLALHDVRYDTENKDKIWTEYCEKNYICALVWTVNYSSNEESLKESSKLFWNSLIELDGGPRNNENSFPILIYCTHYDLFKSSNKYKTNMFNHHKLVEIFELDEFLTYYECNKSDFGRFMFNTINTCLKKISMDMSHRIIRTILTYLMIEFSGSINKSCCYLRNNHKFKIIFCSKDTNDKEFGLKNINYGVEWLMDQKRLN